MGLLALLLALALARGVVYSAVIPPWQVHDEPYHFYSAWIPLLPPAPQQDEAWRNLQTEIASSMIQLRFWDYTPFEQSPQNAQEEHARLEAAIRTRRPAEPRAFTYYLLSAALYPAQHQDVVLQLYWARLWSVVVNIGIIFLAVWAGKMLFRDDPFSRWLLPLLIVFHPQHTFILAGVNDGGIAELFASAAVLAIIALLLRGWRWTWFGLAVVCTALAAAAKPPGAYLVPIVALMIAIYAWQKLRGYWRWIGFVVGLAVLVGVVLAVPRIFIKIRLLETYFNRVGPEEFFVSIITTSASRGFLWAFRSWWAFLGWESLPVSDEWMWTLLVLTGASVIGWGIFVWRYIRDRASVPEDRPIWRVFWMFVLMLVMLGMLVVLQGTVWNEDTFVGRYFFVAMLPTVGLIVLGWREIIPHHWRLEALAAFTVFLFLFDAAVLLAHVVPFFYPLWR
ncbi:MAG: hypothetical protein DDG58_00030 [Ardenticatenia bacterium]|nr:MAG: hypothetical protein DDG58_00030 [Ardenticatenia bacterium]